MIYIRNIFIEIDGSSLKLESFFSKAMVWYLKRKKKNISVACHLSKPRLMYINHSFYSKVSSINLIKDKALRFLFLLFFFCTSLCVLKDCLPLKRMLCVCSHNMYMKVNKNNKNNNNNNVHSTCNTHLIYINQQPGVGPLFFDNKV